MSSGRTETTAGEVLCSAGGGEARFFSCLAWKEIKHITAFSFFAFWDISGNHSGDYCYDSLAGRAAQSFVGVTCPMQGLAQAASAFMSMVLRLAEGFLLSD